MWPGAWICYPTGLPELPLLSPIDVSPLTTGWTCVPLTFDEALSEGLNVARSIARVISLLSE